MHYVYVLRSVCDHGFYIGYSANLRQRLREHAARVSFATSYRGPWKLIYYEAYLDHDLYARAQQTGHGREESIGLKSVIARRDADHVEG